MNYNLIYLRKDKRNILFETLFVKWVHRRFFKKSGKICDVGSGLGNNSLAFKKLGYDVVAVDFDDISFPRLEQNRIKCIKINLNKTKLPFKNNEFDYFFMKSVIEHLENPIDFLIEVKRCLKPEGKIFILTPNWEKSYKRFYDDPTHRSPFSFISLRKTLLIAGFKGIFIRKFRNLPYFWKYFNNLAFEIKWFNAREIIAVT